MVIPVAQEDHQLCGGLFHGAEGAGVGQLLTDFSGKVTTAAAKNGAFGMNATGTGGWGTLIAQTVNVEAGKNYVLSFWYKTNAVGANVQVKQDNNNGAKIEGTGGWDTATEWTYVEYKFTAPTDKVFFNVCGGGNGNAENLYFDDVTLLELGTKTPDRLSGGETSRTEETKTGRGLAFKFTIQANGITVEKGNQVVLTDATVKALNDSEDYQLVDFGALVTNQEAIGTNADAFTTDSLSTSTIRVPAKYLMDLEDDSATYAVRVINIPDENADTTIYARAYYVYENEAGEQIIVYDEIFSDSYNGK